MITLLGLTLDAIIVFILVCLGVWWFILFMIFSAPIWIYQYLKLPKDERDLSKTILGIVLQSNVSKSIKKRLEQTNKKESDEELNDEN